MSIILVGFKNCGKTSVGRFLATKLGISFLDVDHLIEQHYFQETNNLCSTSGIYEEQGEIFFRQLEKRVISQIDPTNTSIIATGGGSVLEEENIVCLKKIGKLLYLSSTPQILLTRLNIQKPPAFLTPNQIQDSFLKHYEQREPIYEAASDFKILTDNKSIAEICDEIIGFHFNQ